MGIPSAQLAQLSMYGQLAGAATSAIGSYSSAQVQRINLQSEAYTADTNARIAELGAQSALLQGQQQVGALTLRAGQLKGSQRASLAANGVDLGTGNAAEVQASTDIMKSIDANTLTANAVRSAWGYRTQATNLQNQAIVARANASSISPATAAASSLMGSASSVSGSWYALKKNGAFDDDSAYRTRLSAASSWAAKGD